MMKNFYLLASIAMIMAIDACSTKTEEQALRFHEDGTFKIVQITDTHYIYDNPASLRADSVIEQVMSSEKPDLVIFTGDQVYGKPAEKALDKQFSIVAAHNIPFIYTFGNHDQEQNLTGRQLLECAQTYPGFLLKTVEDTTIGRAYGEFPVLASNSDSTSAVIYVFDSGDYSTLKDRGVGGYGWITRGQINWYAEKSQEYAMANGGNPVPSVGFYHIPIPEYWQALKDSLAIGIQKENICSPEINTGLFAEMLKQNNMIANFVGHDHDNNYVSICKGIALCYGQFSGGNTEYNHIGAGARVIELHEGCKELRTWIHMLGGEIKDEILIK